MTPPLPRNSVTGTGDSSPGLLLGEMKDIERELMLMANDWAGAERELVRRASQRERLAAPKRFALKKQPPPGVDKPTKEDLDALVLDWLWAEHGELMEAHLIAEAEVAAQKAMHRCLQPALSSKQSRLNADLKLELGSSLNR